MGMVPGFTLLLANFKLFLFYFLFPLIGEELKFKLCVFFWGGRDVLISSISSTKVQEKHVQSQWKMDSDV